MANETRDQAGRDEYQVMRQLLREAKCPHDCNQGVIRIPRREEFGQRAKFCDWCWKRKEVMREA